MEKWVTFLAGLISGIIFGMTINVAKATVPQCSPRETVVAYLAEKYGEHRVAVGTMNQGGVMEIYQNADQTTFSVIVVARTMNQAGQPVTVGCLVAAGKELSFRTAPLPKQPKGTDG